MSLLTFTKSSVCANVQIVIKIIMVPNWRPEIESRSLHMGFVENETESGLVFLGFLPFPLSQISLYTHPIHLVSFHFIHLCDGASDVVGRHPCYSQTFNRGASSHLIP